MKKKNVSLVVVLFFILSILIAGCSCSNGNAPVSETDNQTSGTDNKLDTGGDVVSGGNGGDGNTGDTAPPNDAPPKLDSPQISELEKCLQIDKNLCTLVGKYGVKEGGSPAEMNLQYINSIAYDKNGDLLVYDIYAARILRVDRKTNTIHTVAGNGTMNLAAVGEPATESGIYSLSNSNLAVDSKNNIYFVESQSGSLLKIDSQGGKFVRVAGNGSKPANCTVSPFKTDKAPKPASTFQLCYISSIAIDADDNIYLADYDFHQILRINASDGNIYVYTGSGVGTNDCKNNKIRYPNSMSLHRGTNDLYISSGSRVICKATETLEPSTGLKIGSMEHIAGNGQVGDSGDGGLAATAVISTPIITVDANNPPNIYLTQNPTDRSRIRKVYFNDTDKKYYITGYVGSPTLAIGYSKDGTPMVDANLPKLTTLVMSPEGELTFGGWSLVQRVDTKAKAVYIVAGSIPVERDSSNLGAENIDWSVDKSFVVNDDGGVYLPIYSNVIGSRIIKVNKNGSYTSVAGLPTNVSGGGDDVAAKTVLNKPIALKRNGDALFFIDYGNYVLRMLRNDRITTLIGTPGQRGPSPKGAGDGGEANLASLYAPLDFAFLPDGSMLILDNMSIRKVQYEPNKDIKNWKIDTIYSHPNQLVSIAVVGDKIYFSDYTTAKAYIYELSNSSTIVWSVDAVVGRGDQNYPVGSEPTQPTKLLETAIGSSTGLFSYNDKLYINDLMNGVILKAEFANDRVERVLGVYGVRNFYEKDNAVLTKDGKAPSTKAVVAGKDGSLYYFDTTSKLLRVWVKGLN